MELRRAKTGNRFLNLMLQVANLYHKGIVQTLLDGRNGPSADGPFPGKAVPTAPEGGTEKPQRLLDARGGDALDEEPLAEQEDQEHGQEGHDGHGEQ